jgi:hypothetical protein
MRVPTRFVRALGAGLEALVLIPALALLVMTTACSSDATGPGGEDIDRPPEIASLNVTEESTVYLRGVLTASVTDPENNVTSVVVDWGDGQTVTVTSGFDEISRTHDYARDGAYTVAVSALDAGGNQIHRESALTLTAAPGACLDIKIVGICAQVHPNFEGVDIDISALNNVLQSYSLSTTENSLEFFVPVALLVGQAKVVAESSFSKTKGSSWVRVRVYGCAFFMICTSEVADERWYW